MNTWEKVNFGEVIHFPPKIKMKKGVEYPFIPMENLDSNNKFAKPLSSKVLKGGGAKFEEGDTLFARITPCLQNGKISQAKDLNGTPGFGSTEFFVFRGIEGITDTDFIYYLSKTKFIRESAENSMVGASGRQRADAGFLKNLEIKLPPLLYQKKIVSILSAYDDLIENNLKRIKLLEEKAQLTYEEWFVRMKYPGHENDVVDSETGLPEGWVKKSLKEEINQFINGGWGKEEIIGKNTIPAYVIRGTDISKLKGGDITSLPLRYHTKSNLKSRTLQKGDIILEMSNGNIKNVGRNYFFDNTLDTDSKSIFLCASFCKMIRPSSYSLAILIYCHLQYIYNSDRIDVYRKQASNGINNFDFDKMITDEEINLPIKKVFFDFSAKLESIQNTISRIRAQIGKLKSARDILLPRLVSGMIDIDKIKYNFPKEILE